MHAWRKITLDLVVIICAATQFTVTALVDSDKCGVTKSCFHDPPYCKTPDCDVLITWEDTHTFYGEPATSFGIWGKTWQHEDWVGFGLSRDKEMDDTDVWACMELENRSVVLDHSFNRYDHRNQQLDQTGARNFQYTYWNGLMECTFDRLNSIESHDQFFDLRDGPYYMITAFGPSAPGPGDSVYARKEKLGQHGREPLVSRDMIEFNQITVSYGKERTPGSYKTHGALMITAWIGFASVALILARYFKHMWPNTEVLGQKVWFTFHRILMIIALILCIAAFILIFVVNGGWVKYEYIDDPEHIHAIIGCIVVSLGIINPILAIFRCDPKHSKRWMFSWAHWAIGTTTHILAVVNTFLGSKYVRVPRYATWVLLFWVLCHILVGMFYEILNCVNNESTAFTSYKMYSAVKSDASTKAEADAIKRQQEPMNQTGVEMQSVNTQESNIDPYDNYGMGTVKKQPPPHNSVLRTTVLCIYIVFTVAVVVYLIVEVSLRD
ncbi:putative ferric-chelate reductase 1 [Saccoglossus kowalevskii]|uniref:Ferric-chelate reductase 1-like n=1 Tax=Saccoglossus kowalevskii TaxID=10224 RepID=A0ABM0LXZ6_SACKO|nr:PREDICTED: putative ferric-chelate reductase 1-like [Saccoglossus kowalevskii]